MSGTRRIQGLVLGMLALAMTLALAVPAGAADPRFVYVSSGGFTGSNDLRAFRINANGSLTAVGAPAGVPDPGANGGQITEGIAIVPNGDFLYAAAFGENSVARFEINPSGTLGGGTLFSSAPTPLGVVPDPNGDRLYVWNHGDAIGSYNILGNGSLSGILGQPFAVPGNNTNPFDGSVAPDGNHMYVPYENTAGPPENVGAWSISGTGVLTEIQVLPSGNPANNSNPFGSAITPDGRFLYVSNPDDLALVGTISGFRIFNNGLMSQIDVSPGVAGDWRSASPGLHPLGMAISPDGDHLYVATRASSTVNAYNIAVDGSLSPIPGQPFPTGGTNGKALALTPDGERLYVSNQGSNNISGFDVNPNGSLSLIGQTPTGGTDNDLASIAITPNQGPFANFTVNEGVVGLRTDFNANSSFDPDGDPEIYEWDFGDGTTTTGPDPTVNHVYTTPGTYGVTLRVTDDEGCSDERIFTGKPTLCNANPQAEDTLTITIVAPKCFGQPATIVGTASDEVLVGTPGPDVIGAHPGNDVIRGRGGRDRICGSDGRDKVNGGDGNDLLRGGPGPDTIAGGPGNDRANGGPGNDKMFGGPGRDALVGLAGNDVLRGGPGQDSLRGAPGRDTEIQ